MGEKLFLLVTLFLTIFTTSIAQAGSFSLINSNFTIAGSMGGDLNVSGTEHIDEGYSFNSSISMADEVTFLDAYAMSEASYRNVSMSAANTEGLYLYGYETEEHIRAFASAKTILDFRPDFNGLGAIDFTLQQGNDPGHHSYAALTLTDTTASINILQMSTVGPRYMVSLSSLAGVLPESVDWIEEGVWGLTGSGGFGAIPFTFAAWDSSHEYQLSMVTETSEMGNPHEIGSAEIKTNMVFSNVPEPTTLLLLSFGLIGLAGARRKIKK